MVFHELCNPKQVGTPSTNLSQVFFCSRVGCWEPLKSFPSTASLSEASVPGKTLFEENVKGLLEPLFRFFYCDGLIEVCIRSSTFSQPLVGGKLNCLFTEGLRKKC